MLRDDGTLVEMSERAYDSEDLLQTLLAKYPSILAGDQMHAADPRCSKSRRPSPPFSRQSNGC